MPKNKTTAGLKLDDNGVPEKSKIIKKKDSNKIPLLRKTL